MPQYSIVISDQMDQCLRTFLGSKGLKKCSLSRFVEKAFTGLLRFEETVSRVQQRNLRYPESEIMADIDEAVKATRVAPCCQNSEKPSSG